MIAVLAATVACTSSPVTRLELELAYDPGWAVDTLLVRVGGLERQIPIQERVSMIVPDGWAGVEQSVEVIGMRADASRARARVTTVPRARSAVLVPVPLVEVPCGDACVPGSLACAGEAVVTCARAPDGCTAWVAPRPCEVATPWCSLGTCGETCFDECAPGETRCVGGGAVQACGQADGDDCRDWMIATPCSPDTPCSAGACRDVCVDACELDATRCVGSGVSTCGDVDGDGCAEWSPAVPCDSGVCDAGACAATCTNDCDASRCDGSSWRRCGQFDVDTCRDLSSGTSCAPSDPCQVGSCTPTGGCAQTPLICEDPPEPTCVDESTLRTYRADGTCNAGSCDYAHTDVRCAGGTCEGGACVCAETSCVTVLVDDAATDGPEDLAVDETHVYWTEKNLDTVLRRPKSLSGPTETLATGQLGAAEVEVDATHVYWTNSQDHRVMRRAKTPAGAPLEVVATGQTGAWGLALDATHVYWTTTTGDTVMRRAKTLGASTPETVASAQDEPYGLAVDATHVYWGTRGTTSPGVKRRDKALATAVQNVANSVKVVVVVLDGTYVYWGESETFKLQRRVKTLASPTQQVYTDTSAVWSIALDGDHVYWGATGTQGSGAIRRRRAALDAPVETLVKASLEPDGLALDASHLYWGDFQDGVVERLSRCACEL